MSIRAGNLRLRGTVALCVAFSTIGARAQTSAPQAEQQQAAVADDPAQPPPATPPPAEAKPAPPAPPPVPRTTVILPSEKSADIQTHWNARRDYLRDRDERRADDEEQRVRALKDDLQIENLFFIGAALVRESHDALAAGVPVVAIDRCKRAVDFAPALPDAHTCLARALLTDSLGNFKPAADQLFAAFKAALDDPRTSRAMLANLVTVLLFGLLIAGAAYSLLLFARYGSLYTHDVHHLFPSGARRWQTRMLAAVIVLLPLFLQAGPVALLFTLLLAVALYATTVEVTLACLFLLALAASPWAASGVARIAAFGGPAVDVWLLEHGEGSPAEIARLQKKLEAGPDLPIAFALARKAKRDGDFATAETLYKKALEASGSSNSGLAAVHNNLGNVYLLEGDTQKALKEYQSAIDLVEGLAAPHFNVSRALSMGGVETLEKVQSEQARALELDRPGIDTFTGGQLQANRKSNRFVMDVTLDDALLQPLIDSESNIAEPVADEVRAQLAWGLPGPLAPILPLAAAVLVVLLHMLRGKMKPSSECERCGREVCKRCDPDARPSENLCAQCVNVFIRRTGVDAAERIRKEYAVQAFHRRRWTLARVLGVISGAGHVMLGYPLRGIVFLLLTGSLLASVILWSGIAHDPIAVRNTLSPFRIAVAGAGFLFVYALCLRDLVARQRAEGA